MNVCNHKGAQRVVDIAFPDSITVLCELCDTTTSYKGLSFTSCTESIPTNSSIQREVIIRTVVKEKGGE